MQKGVAHPETDMGRLAPPFGGLAVDVIIVLTRVPLSQHHEQFQKSLFSYMLPILFTIVSQQPEEYLAQSRILIHICLWNTGLFHDSITPR